MGFSDNEFDITKNIKIIEWLKSELLESTSSLYKSMLQTSEVDNAERSEILANMTILIYILSDRLGISYNTLDLKVLNKLKLGILDEENNKDFNNDFKQLSRHIDKNRDIYK